MDTPNTNSVSFKISVGFMRYVIPVLLALSAFYPVYPWVPRLTFGLFCLFTCIAALGAFVMLIIAMATYKADSKELVKSNEKQDVDAAYRKVTGTWFSFQFWFFLIVNTVLAYCAGFAFTGSVYLICLLVIRYSNLATLKRGFEARKEVLAEAVA